MYTRRQMADLMHYFCVKQFYLVSLGDLRNSRGCLLACGSCAHSRLDYLSQLQDTLIFSKHSIHSRSYLLQWRWVYNCFLCGQSTLAIQELCYCFECFVTVFTKRMRKPRGSLIDSSNIGINQEVAVYALPQRGSRRMNELRPLSPLQTNPPLSEDELFRLLVSKKCPPS